MKTMLNIKIEKDLKAKAQKVAKDIGLPLSSILNRYLKEFVQEKRVEFKESYVPNAKTAKLLDKALRDMDAGKNMSPKFTNAKDFITYLNKK